MCDKPLYKLIYYLNGTYLYDTNKNEILPISSELYSYLSGSFSLDTLPKEKNVNDEISKLISNGYLSDKKPASIEHSQTGFVKSLLKDVKRITLQVTQACNFKCRYCGYAGDNYLNRHHNGSTMTWDVAKKSIDFFAEHNIDSPVANIGFYGGEPFLEVDLIRKCIEYIEKKLRGKKIEYYITTNGSVMNSTIVELLNNYSIHLTISLDGPKELHNKNRRYAINGKPTYDDVIKNIQYLKQEVFDFERKISINSVVDQEEDYNDYYEFFNDNNSIINIEHTEDIIDDSRLARSIPTSIKYVKSISRKRLNSYIDLLSGVSKTDAVTKQILKEIEDIKEKFSPANELPNVFHHNGPCVPGYSRLFVTVKGVLYPCEKCSENSEALQIGDIYNGFDYNSVLNLLNIGRLTSEKCKNCVIMRHCSICAQQIDDIKELSVNEKRRHCQINNQAFMQNVKKYIALSKIGLL